MGHRRLGMCCITYCLKYSITALFMRTLTHQCKKKKKKHLGFHVLLKVTWTGREELGIEPKTSGLKDDPFFYLLSHSHLLREKCVMC